MLIRQSHLERSEPLKYNVDSVREVYYTFLSVQFQAKLDARKAPIHFQHLHKVFFSYWMINQTIINWKLNEISLADGVRDDDSSRSWSLSTALNIFLLTLYGNTMDVLRENKEILYHITSNNNIVVIRKCI